MWMVRIKIRIVRLVHHLAAHYTLLSAHDTSLVRDRRETEKSTYCDSVAAPVLISAIATNGRRADSPVYQLRSPRLLPATISAVRTQFHCTATALLSF